LPEALGFTHPADGSVSLAVLAKPGHRRAANGLLFRSSRSDLQAAEAKLQGAPENARTKSYGVYLIFEIRSVQAKTKTLPF
jgi:hypothetical protein